MLFVDLDWCYEVYVDEMLLFELEVRVVLGWFSLVLLIVVEIGYGL